MWRLSSTRAIDKSCFSNLANEAWWVVYRLHARDRKPNGFSCDLMMCVCRIALHHTLHLWKNNTAIFRWLQTHDRYFCWNLWAPKSERIFSWASNLTGFETAREVTEQLYLHHKHTQKRAEKLHCKLERRQNSFYYSTYFPYTCTGRIWPQSHT